MATDRPQRIADFVSDAGGQASRMRDLFLMQQLGPAPPAAPRSGGNGASSSGLLFLQGRVQRVRGARRRVFRRVPSASLAQVTHGEHIRSQSRSNGRIAGGQQRDTGL